jgi:hypothetical protein
MLTIERPVSLQTYLINVLIEMDILSGNWIVN